jgi:hypothetical protein
MSRLARLVARLDYAAAHAVARCIAPERAAQYAAHREALVAVAAEFWAGALRGRPELGRYLRCAAEVVSGD